MSEIIGTNWLILTPIVLLSVIAIAVIIEKGLYFYRIRAIGETDLSRIIASIGTQSATEILEGFPDHDRSPVRGILEFALTSRTRAVLQVYKQRLESLRDRSLDRMERHLAVLNGIANISTLLGLYGTVAGMITVFSRMNESGSSDPYILAGGISKALVTTAAGLLVAIPAMLAHHFFEALVDRHAEQMDEAVAECLFVSGVNSVRAKRTETTAS